MYETQTYNPQTFNISPIKTLDQLIKQYPNQALIPQFIQLKNNYPCYRAVRGDGNCFYRAIAFLYLRQTNLNSFNNIFKPIKNVCINHQLHFERGDFQFQLAKIYKDFLQKLKSLNLIEKEQKLAQCFNYLIFDKILIMYFRSLNYLYIKQNLIKYREFNSDINIFERIKIFGNDSEGIQYSSMAQALSIRINVKIIDQQSLTMETYNEQERNKEVDIFFRPGHFDILYHKSSNYIRGKYWNLRQKRSLQQQENMREYEIRMNHREMGKFSQDNKFAQQRYPLITQNRIPKIFRKQNGMKIKTDRQSNIRSWEEEKMNGILKKQTEKRNDLEQKRNSFNKLPSLRGGVEERSPKRDIQNRKLNQNKPLQSFKSSPVLQNRKQSQISTHNNIISGQTSKNTPPYNTDTYWGNEQDVQNSSHTKIKQLSFIIALSIFVLFIILKL